MVRMDHSLLVECGVALMTGRSSSSGDADRRGSSESMRIVQWRLLPLLRKLGDSLKALEIESFGSRKVCPKPQTKSASKSAHTATNNSLASAAMRDHKILEIAYVTRKGTFGKFDRDSDGGAIQL